MSSSRKKHKRKKRRIVGKIIKYFVLLIVAALCIIGAACFGIFFGAVDSAEDVQEVNVIPMAYASTILDSDGNEIITLSTAEANRSEATSEEITDYLRYAFIDIEDERFYTHNGIDIKGIFRAIYNNLTTGSSEGASTITQQLLKNNVFETGGFERSTGSTVKRKIQEWVMAINLEKYMSKEEILVAYLNTINLGGGTYGVKAAAEYYFGKDLEDLTISECAVLAAITQNPTAYNPANNPEANQERQLKVLANMLENGHITEEEYAEAVNDDVYSRISAITIQNEASSTYSYFVDALIEQVMEDLQEDAGYTYSQAYNLVYTGGITIYSTQNTTAQEILETEINDESNFSAVSTSYSISWDITITKADGSVEYYNQNHLTAYFQEQKSSWTLDFDTTEEADAAVEEYKATIVEDGDTISFEQIFYTLQPQASFTLMDYTTGQVLAIVGGRGEKETSLSFNRATDSYRQPGSTFKVVAVFAPLLDTGKGTLASTFDDAEFTYPGSTKSVQNWWGNSYRGLSSVKLGIRNSMNIVAVKAMYKLGVYNSVSYLQSFGYSRIDETEDANLSTALGGITYGVTNLEQTAAYGAIANGGVYIEPTFYTKIVSMDGNVILEKEQETHQVISTETASLITYALRDCVLNGTGAGCAISSAPLAGKTGTTNDANDLWFIGFVPNGLIGTIWVGYDENLDISNVLMHKAIYAKIMEQLVVALEKTGGSFDMDGNIVEVSICTKSGMLPTELCEEEGCVSTEYFDGNNVPTETCTVHQLVSICTESGLLATEYCPEECVEEVICIIRPDDIDGTEAKGTTSDSDSCPPEEECDIHDETTTTTTAETTETTSSGSSTSSSSSSGSSGYRGYSSSGVISSTTATTQSSETSGSSGTSSEDNLTDEDALAEDDEDDEGE